MGALKFRPTPGMALCDGAQCQLVLATIVDRLLLEIRKASALDRRARGHSVKC